MKIYATNIKITPVEGTSQWLTCDDYNRWSKSFFDRKDWKTQQGAGLPPGVVCNARAGHDFLVKWIDVDLPLPKGKINHELREAIYAISYFADVTIECEQHVVLKDVYEGTHGVTVDLEYAVEYQDEDEAED